MCFDVGYIKQEKDNVADVMCSIHEKSLQLNGFGAELYGEARITIPNYDFPVELDHVYYWTSNELMYGIYPSLFHAYRKQFLMKKEVFWFEHFTEYPGMPMFIFVPTIIEDVVYFDNIQVAGRVMYLFSPKSWREYQEVKPIHIFENEIIVETECKL